jgi:hypothetical protein
MEIREGIKFQHGNETHILSFDVKFNIWKSNPKLVHQWSTDYLLSNFKSNHFKLLEYPYKVGDWVYDIKELYVKSHNTPQICQITEIEEDLDNSEYTKIFVNNETCGLTLEFFSKEYRPCFQDEIPTNQVVKEDMEYLIPFINQLNE